jgi:succinate dehydrogenase / fumarate reductase cytochrome b subunit
MAMRPKYLNLLQIRMPAPAVVSILHRISGALLFAALPVLLWWLEQSLASADAYAAYRQVFSGWCFKIVALGLVWAYLHHLCAGIRHLAMDVHLGLELHSARLSSMVVLAVSIALTAAIGVLLIW